MQRVVAGAAAAAATAAAVATARVARVGVVGVAAGGLRAFAAPLAAAAGRDGARRGCTTRGRPFADRVRVQVIGGRGGKGLVSFESLTQIKKRPVGGRGGAGGDVILEASHSVPDLAFQTFVLRGRDGTDATGNGNNGRAGRDKKFMVPVGTLVKEVVRTYDLEYDAPPDADDSAPAAATPSGGDEEEGAEAPLHGRRGRRGRGLRGTVHASDDDAAPSAPPASAPSPPPSKPKDTEDVVRYTHAGQAYRERKVVLADLDVHGQSLLVARGGAPGAGNKGSTLTYAQQLRGVDKPHVSGGHGETRFLELELKMIADVGLVGFPNAGKSSLVGALSKAKPRVADYPFTTLKPTVGVVNFRDAFTLTVADIPGLIEGAHADRGLGHEFLRHIERTKLLAYVVDASGFGGDPVADYHALQRELQLYDPGLLAKPAVVIANKMDTPGAAAGARRLRAATPLPVLEVSALVGTGVAAAVDALRWLAEAHAKQAARAAATAAAAASATSNK